MRSECNLFQGKRTRFEGGEAITNLHESERSGITALHCSALFFTLYHCFNVVNLYSSQRKKLVKRQLFRNFWRTIPRTTSWKQNMVQVIRRSSLTIFTNPRKWKSVYQQGPQIFPFLRQWSGNWKLSWLVYVHVHITFLTHFLPLLVPRPQQFIWHRDRSFFRSWQHLSHL